MKNIRALAWVLLVYLASASALATTTTQGWFYGKCSGRATGVTTAGSTRFALRVAGLPSGHSIQMRLKFRPEGDGPREDLVERSLWKNIVSSDGTVRFLVDFDPPELGPGQARGWIAEATWNDLDQPSTVGAVNARIYVSSSEQERLYQLVGPPVCRWQQDPVLWHPYRLNTSGYTVSVEQEVEVNRLSPGKGIELAPVSSGASNGEGWFFPRWEDYYGAEARKVRQAWQLPMNAGGFLASELKFTRYEAREFVQRKVDGCWTWVPGRSGLLDVGAEETNFYLVPSTYANDDARALQLIRESYALLNSCDASLPHAALSARVGFSSDRYPMYFYAR